MNYIHIHVDVHVSNTYISVKIFKRMKKVKSVKVNNTSGTCIKSPDCG